MASRIYSMASSSLARSGASRPHHQRRSPALALQQPARRGRPRYTSAGPLKLGTGGMIIIPAHPRCWPACAAVQDVHHGAQAACCRTHRPESGRGADPERWRRGPQRWRPPGWHLRRGWTCPLCRPPRSIAVHGVGVGGIKADQRRVDDSVDVLHRLADALAAETAFIAVAQLQCLELAGGCAAPRPPTVPSASQTSASTVGLPRESMISRPMTFSISR